MIKKLPIVGVMGSGEEEHPELSIPLGRWLATLPIHLLTGGGQGVMKSVSRAFAEVPDRQGMVIGVLPWDKSGYPNNYVEIPIRTHLSKPGVKGTDELSRNPINVLTSDIVIALPGGSGTLSEVLLSFALTRPILAFIKDRTDIPDLPDHVWAISNFEELQAEIVFQLGL